VAAGPQISRCSSSATAITKAPASRVASSRRSRPASGFHHQPWPACAIRCGSKVHTRRPVAAARSAAVARYRSGLFEHATTAPGASSTAGTATAVVFPDRGAKTARITSSQLDCNSGPRASRGRSALEHAG